jgi:phage gp29-like protein
MSKRKTNAQGRPRAIEGEQLVVGNDLLATMIDPKQGGVYFLTIDEIVARKGWATYKEMLHDDQVKACLEFKKILVVGRAFELKPADDSSAAALQAKFVEEVFSRLNIEEVLHNALTAFEFGYSLAEQVFERDIWDARNDGDGKQYVFLKKLQHRDPRDLVLKMDYHGNYVGMKQWGVAGVPKGVVELAPEKTWLFTHDKRFGNLYGQSDLRAAYRSWWAKKFVIQFWNVYLERFGAPMTKMTYPLGASDQLKTNLKTILSNLSSKTEILVPEGVNVNLVEATRGGNAGYEQALSFHNNSIARAMLMVALLGADGDANRQTASTSQSFLHVRILFKVADQISQKLSASLMEQVIRPLLDLNFETPAYPDFIWQDYGQFEGMAVADEIRQLHAAGIIEMDQRDVNYVRSILGLPLRDELDDPDEVIRPQPLPPPGGGAGQPPAPEDGNTRADKGGGKGKPTGKQPGTKGGTPKPAQRETTNSQKHFALVLREVEEEAAE